MYKVVKLSTFGLLDGSYSEIEEILNRESKDGWEYISFEYCGKEDKSFIVLKK